MRKWGCNKGGLESWFEGKKDRVHGVQNMKNSLFEVCLPAVLINCCIHGEESNCQDGDHSDVDDKAAENDRAKTAPRLLFLRFALCNRFLIALEMH